MVLRHADAESSLETPRRAARHWISLVPSKGFGSLFQHLHRGEGIVRIPRVALPGPRDVRETELHRVYPERVRHVIHHDFPGPLRLLLHETAGGTRTGGVCV